MPAFIRGEVRPRTGDKVMWGGAPATWKTPIDGKGKAVIMQNGKEQAGSEVDMATVANKYKYDFEAERWERRHD